MGNWFVHGRDSWRGRLEAGNMTVTLSERMALGVGSSAPFVTGRLFVEVPL